MKAGTKTAREKPPEKQLAEFVGKFDIKNQALITSCRKALRKRLPGADELVYDNYNFFVIGYSPTGRPSDTIISLAAGSSGVGMAFPYCGTRLPDPHKLLQGSGTKNRFIRVESPSTLAKPEVEALIAAALKLCKPLPSGKGRLIIRSISAKQRPRRK
jgi:hypothetical protein